MVQESKIAEEDCTVEEQTRSRERKDSATVDSFSTVGFLWRCARGTTIYGTLAKEIMPAAPPSCMNVGKFKGPSLSERHRHEGAFLLG